MHSAIVKCFVFNSSFYLAVLQTELFYEKKNKSYILIILINIYNFVKERYYAKLTPLKRNPQLREQHIREGWLKK